MIVYLKIIVVYTIMEFFTSTILTANMLVSDIYKPIAFSAIGFLFSSYLHSYKGFNLKILNEKLKNILNSKISPLSGRDPIYNVEQTLSHNECISIHDELVIIDNHRDVISKCYKQAVKENNTDYIYYPLYINNKRYPLVTFSKNVIGLEIIDPKFIEDSMMLSDDAIITDIIDVGGMDLHNRNEIDRKKGI